MLHRRRDAIPCRTRGILSSFGVGGCRRSRRIAHHVGPSLKPHSQTLCDSDRGRIVGMDHADDVRLFELRERHSRAARAASVA